LGTRTCREILEEALSGAGFWARLLPAGPGLSMEAGSAGDQGPLFQVEVLPPGVLPEEPFYREARGFRIRYRMAPGAMLSGSEQQRVTTLLDRVAETLPPGASLGLEFPATLITGAETGTPHWLEIGGGRTRELLLRIDFHCNQACPFCFVRLGPRRLAPADVVELVGSVLRPESDEVMLTGGEPTTHPEFLEVLRGLSRPGVRRIGLQTNGVRFEDPELVRQVRDLGVRRVLFSFHSHQPEVYDRITRSHGQFHRAVQGLRNLAAESPPLAVTVNVVLTRLNLGHLSDLVRFVADILEPSEQASTFFWTMMNDVGHQKVPEWAVPLEEMGPALDRALEVCRTLPRTVDPFLGDCAPPLCILSDPDPVMPGAEAIAAMTPREDIDYLSAGEPVPPHRRAKARDCRRCRHDPYCHGIPSALAARYGLAALRPREP